MRAAQPCGNILLHIIALSPDIRRYQHVLDAELTTHTGDISPGKIGNHPPIVGVRHWFDAKIAHQSVQPIAAITPAAQRKQNLWPAITAPGFIQELTQLRFPLQSQGAVIVAIRTHSGSIKPYEGKRFWQYTARTSSQRTN